MAVNDYGEDIPRTRPPQRGLRQGRYPSLTAPMLGRYLDCLRETGQVRIAANIIGVSESVARYWLYRGRRAMKYGLNGDEQIYATLARRSDEVIAERIEQLLQEIRRQGTGGPANPRPDWRALQWIAAVTKPDLYGDYARDIRDLRERIKQLENNKQQ